MTLVNGLKASPSGLYKLFHSKAQEIEDTLNFLKEDHGPHKLVLLCLEQLNTTVNYKHAATILLMSLRRHVRKYGDAQRHAFYH